MRACEVQVRIHSAPQCGMVPSQAAPVQRLPCAALYGPALGCSLLLQLSALPTGGRCPHARPCRATRTSIDRVSARSPGTRCLLTRVRNWGSDRSFEVVSVTCSFVRALSGLQPVLCCLTVGRVPSVLPGECCWQCKASCGHNRFEQLLAQSSNRPRWLLILRA